MAEYFAFQAALCFSVAHVLLRRGLVYSNALTGSVISLGTSAAIVWLLVLVFIPLSALQTPAIGYFIVGGFFAPAMGQTLGYIGIERIGVARTTPIVNSAPMFSSFLAVFFLGEIWTPQNILGTALVIVGVIILSSGKPAQGRWQKMDVIYPVLAAVAFGISTLLRKTGLMVVQMPMLAAAVTIGTAFLVLLTLVWLRGGRQALEFNRHSGGWLFGAALANTGAILSVFSALNVGKIVEVEPLIACNPLLTILWTAIFLRQIERLSGRIVLGASVTVIGTILVVTVK
ncbi:MAG: EamA family transporter [Deltaproteobacteria bacterium]|nr:EamA family transporter [Deltaproteobacteria bacterium]